MAIQVGGTTVIDDSRNLSNVGGLKTVGGNSILGSGDIATGGSTTQGAVGTYVWAGKPTTSSNYYTWGSTYAGSDLWPAGHNSNNSQGGGSGTSAYLYTPSNSTIYSISSGVNSLSGTWRAMGHTNSGTFSSYGPTTLFVRIS